MTNIVEKESFTDSSWETPVHNEGMTTENYCSLCLIDSNPPGAEKVKSKCHLPVRSTPGGPINRAALRNAAARFNQVQGVSSEDKASAKRKLARLMSAAGIESSLNKEEDDPVDIELSAEIIKSDDEKRIAYGVVYPAQPDTWSDTQGDWMSAAEIEAMAHRWLAKSQQYDLQHQIIGLPREQAMVVESYIAPADFTLGNKPITKGSWIVATHFPSPEIWQQVKKGQVNAYSIRGKAKRGLRPPLPPNTNV